ncbi:hypothetical protein GWO43_15710 [candidate division KSB1 bacterium]|nr:hypothetical protein [candidate division KSB1 bacterium]NIS25401.1 hypothetical protein [candidate division KSB1 bacterium]NIT72289.1 hypothetical protein [candidate division KSB1 bacterium]NIU25696.1 hypothetical protein [candidate division KSB1 bacterium]NIU93446.1 hypothetical protein [candidate division KSB1 bacterium]
MRTATYTVSGPFASEALDVSVRLRFRSFPPYFLRAIGEDDLLDELIIFDMENFEGTINVN